MKAIPVVDGDSGSIDQYGRATTERGALRVARKWFVDIPERAYIAHKVRLRTGQLLTRAWVVMVKQPN